MSKSFQKHVVHITTVTPSPFNLFRVFPSLSRSRIIYQRNNLSKRAFTSSQTQMQTSVVDSSVGDVNRNNSENVIDNESFLCNMNDIDSIVKHLEQLKNENEEISWIDPFLDHIEKEKKTDTKQIKFNFSKFSEQMTKLQFVDGCQSMATHNDKETVEKEFKKEENRITINNKYPSLKILFENKDYFINSQQQEAQLQQNEISFDKFINDVKSNLDNLDETINIVDNCIKNIETQMARYDVTFKLQRATRVLDQYQDLFIKDNKILPNDRNIVESDKDEFNKLKEAFFECGHLSDDEASHLASIIDFSNRQREYNQFVKRLMSKQSPKSS